MLSDLKIWGRKAAFNVQKVLWCAEELGLVYEQVDAGQHYGKNKEPFFLAMNPNGRVPVIEVQGMALWESHAIIRFLCAHADTSGLSADDPVRWAHGDQWLDWLACTLYYPTFRNYYLYQTRTPADRKDPAIVKTMRDEVFASMTILEAQLAGRDTILGDGLSSADFSGGVIVDKFVRIEGELPSFPAIRAYHNALLKRPLFCRHVNSYALDAV